MRACGMTGRQMFAMMSTEYASVIIPSILAGGLLSVLFCALYSHFAGVSWVGLFPWSILMIVLSVYTLLLLTSYTSWLHIAAEA